MWHGIRGNGIIAQAGHTTLVWAAANWLAIAAGFAALLLLLLAWSYSRAG